MDRHFLPTIHRTLAGTRRLADSPVRGAGAKYSTPAIGARMRYREPRHMGPHRLNMSCQLNWPLKTLSRARELPARGNRGQVSFGGRLDAKLMCDFVAVTDPWRPGGDFSRSILTLILTLTLTPAPSELTCMTEWRAEGSSPSECFVETGLLSQIKVPEGVGL
jgi:hypothetical protein